MASGPISNSIYLDEGYGKWGKNHRKATCEETKDTFYLIHTSYDITVFFQEMSSLQITNYFIIEN